MFLICFPLFLLAPLVQYPPTVEVGFNKQGFDELMKRRFVYAPAFEIYGGMFPVRCQVAFFAVLT